MGNVGLDHFRLSHTHSVGPDIGNPSLLRFMADNPTKYEADDNCDYMTTRDNMRCEMATMYVNALKLTFLLLLMACHPKLALAKSWTEAIQDVSSLADEYTRALEGTGFSEVGLIGNQGLEVQYEEHMCAIIGRRMGHFELIRHLEPPQPSLYSNPATLAYNARSLRHWVRAAKRFRDLPEGQRRAIWNLECVGRHGISTDGAVSRSPSVRFESDGAYIWVEGDIRQGFFDALRKAVSSNPDVETIGLGSGGGAVYEAMRAGAFIRQLGLKTQLSGECYSACPLVFLGGVERNVMRPHPKIGLHEVSINGIAVSKDDKVYDIMSTYIRALGADDAAIINIMQAYRPDEMGTLPAQVACDTRIVTWHQGHFSATC